MLVSQKRENLLWKVCGPQSGLHIRQAATQNSWRNSLDVQGMLWMPETLITHFLALLYACLAILNKPMERLRDQDEIPVCLGPEKAEGRALSPRS